MFITGQGRFHLEAQIAEPFNSLRQPASARQHASIAAHMKINQLRVLGWVLR
jgi:hypothetical protein